MWLINRRITLQPRAVNPWWTGQPQLEIKDLEKDVDLSRGKELEMAPESTNCLVN
jgi:hypothetical protein